MRIYKSETISKWEIACVVINLMTYKLFTLVPVIFSKEAGTAAFISSVYTGVITLAVVWLLLRLYRRGGEINLVSTAGTACFKAGRYVSAAVVTAYLITAAVFALYEIAGLVKTMAFPTAPLWFIEIFLIAAAVIAALRGRQGIIRTHLIVVPAVVAITVVVFASVFSDAEPSNLFPLLGKGADGIFAGGIKGIALYSDILFLFMLEPYCAEQGKLKKTVLGSAVFSVVLSCVFVLIYTMIVPYPASAVGEYPVYMIMKSVYYGRFLQRADAVYMLFIILSGMLYLSFAVSLVPGIAQTAFGGEGSSGYAVLAGIAVFLTAQNRGFFSGPGSFKGICTIGGIFALTAIAGIAVGAAKRRRSNEAM